MTADEALAWIDAERAGVERTVNNHYEYRWHVVVSRGFSRVFGDGWTLTEAVETAQARLAERDLTDLYRSRRTS